jgi:Xaa-Pro aminopeptidase
MNETLMKFELIFDLQGEYVAPNDHRREFISGFTGSAGTAVVTDTVAALWTDGRYFLQGENQLDCNWILMKQGQTGVSIKIIKMNLIKMKSSIFCVDEQVPSITEWLTEVMTSTDRVAADPTLVGADTWLGWKQRLG